MTSAHDCGSARCRPIDEIILRIREGASEDGTEAKEDKRQARQRSHDAIERRYESRVEANGKEGEAIGEEQGAETQSTLVGWGIGTGGGTVFLTAGPLGFIAGLIPAHKWRQIGEAGAKGLSEGERKAAVDANHAADLQSLQVDMAEAMDKSAGDRTRRARFAEELAKSFASEVRAGRSRAIEAQGAGIGAAQGSAAYQANLQNTRNALDAITESAEESREARAAAAEAKKKHLQEAHKAERLRIHSTAIKAIKEGLNKINSEIGLALSWCTMGISAAAAEAANSVVNVAVEKAMEGTERDAAIAQRNGEALQRQALLLEYRAEEAEQRIDTEHGRLDDIASQQTSILRKMQA